MLKIDSSAVVGYLAACSSFVAVFCTLSLPKTRPQAKPPTSLAERLGLTSFKLLRSRDIGVVIIASCLFMMPLSAFFMHTPLHMSCLGIDRIAATMAIGQVTEIFALLGMGYIMRRFRFRTLMTLGFVFAFLRYALFAMVDENSIWMLIVGISLHGLCWSFFFEVGRAFLDQRAPAEFRAQIQALVTLGTGGVGSIAGTMLVGLAYGKFVTENVGWPGYWWLLAVWCLICGLGFVLFFRE